MKEMTREQFAKSVAIAKFKVKIRSLAEEARIIRHVARKRKRHVLTEKYGTYTFTSFVSSDLRSHNVTVVRPEQRHTLLAYAFYRGVPYASVERCADDNKPSLERIARIVKSLTNRDCLSDVMRWADGQSVERKTA